MALGQWIFSGHGSGDMDTSIKYGGTGSYKAEIRGSVQNAINALARNNFTCTQLMVILWTRIEIGTGTTPYPPYENDTDAYVRHPSYGDLNVGTFHKYGGGGGQVIDWAKYRVWFWYDSAVDRKFGRIEKWDGSNWVQQGPDINFGPGAPSADSAVLKIKVSTQTYDAYTKVWFDDLEVYRLRLT